jgi:SAM-dependent methyltransferase
MMSEKKCVPLRAKQVYEDAYRDTTGPGTFDWKVTHGLPREGLRILSVGGGSGADLWHLKQDNEICVLDGSQSAVEQAKSHGLTAEVVDLDGPLPYPDKNFDVVVAKDILEHLVNPARLLTECRRVLRNDGVLVVSVPNHFYLPFRLRILFGHNLIWKTAFHDHTKLYAEWDYMHLRFFTYGGFERFLRMYGFKPFKRFWDLGTLAHYADPTAFQLHMLEKYQSRPLTRKAKFYFRFLRPMYVVFNSLFPRGLRARLVSFVPGLLCAGFYYQCRKSDEDTAA